MPRHARRNLGPSMLPPPPAALDRFNALGQLPGQSSAAAAAVPVLGARPPGQGASPALGAVPPVTPGPAPPAPPPGGGAAGGGPPPTTNQMLANQFGTGDLFSPLGMFGNPLDTAQTRAQRLLDQNLAETQAGFSGRGMGNSSRAALARGEAVGRASAELGDTLARLGLQNRQTEQNQLGQMLLGAGQQGLSAQQLALNANAQLGNQGGTLMNIGQTEMTPQGIEAILQFLGIQHTGRTIGQTA